MGRLLADLHAIISVPPGEMDQILNDPLPPPWGEFCEFQFFHASLPDFLLDRSRSRDLFVDEGAAYLKFTELAVKHINNPTKSPIRNQCTAFLIISA